MKRIGIRTKEIFGQVAIQIIKQIGIKYEEKWTAPNGLKIECDEYPEYLEAPDTLFIHGADADENDRIIVVPRITAGRIIDAINYFNTVHSYPVKFNWSILPPWFKWIAKDGPEPGNNAWWAYASKPRKPAGLNKCWRGGAGKEFRIDKKYAPKNFKGNWKDSLMERPRNK